MRHAIYQHFLHWAKENGFKIESTGAGIDNRKITYITITFISYRFELVLRIYNSRTDCCLMGPDKDIELSRFMHYDPNFPVSVEQFTTQFFKRFGQ